MTALGHYISACGGSRGVRAICSEAGTRCPDAKVEDLSRFRFVEEQTKNRNEKLIVSRVDDGIAISAVSVDLTLEVKREFFEKGWV
ncbi:MAG: succinate dehydrogenase / fumarate reductase flavoprotein subunit [Yoonia sp.]